MWVSRRCSHTNPHTPKTRRLCSHWRSSMWSFRSDWWLVAYVRIIWNFLASHVTVDITHTQSHSQDGYPERTTAAPSHWDTCFSNGSYWFGYWVICRGLRKSILERRGRSDLYAYFLIDTPNIQFSLCTRARNRNVPASQQAKVAFSCSPRVRPWSIRMRIEHTQTHMETHI